MSLFPDSFVWGAAAASYQIEGATLKDGRGPSVWDAFCNTEGKVLAGHTGATACNHYDHFADDVALMAQIGLDAYRFSISWPRILPEGTGRIESRGLDFYDRLVDSLLESGIEPYATLFHWDYPLELYFRGGWLNRDSAAWFGEYTEVITLRLSDRVTNWGTINEPQCPIVLGHEKGEHAPGDRRPRAEVLRAMHHILMAHGKAVQALRATAARPVSVGLVAAFNPRVPESGSEPDLDAAVQANFEHDDIWSVGWWCDPVHLGRYPDSVMKKLDGIVQDGDLELISTPTDYLGVNTYFSSPVRMGDDGQIWRLPAEVGAARSAMDWPVREDALYWATRLLYERYRTPIQVLENGIACNDWVELDGRVRDSRRIDFTARHLLHLARALEEGVPVQSYFHWSLMDNFEWAYGYSRRFGLIHIDYQSQARTLKDSAYWYADVIRSRGKSLQPKSRPTPAFSGIHASGA